MPPKFNALDAKRIAEEAKQRTVKAAAERARVARKRAAITRRATEKWNRQETALLEAALDKFTSLSRSDIAYPKRLLSLGFKIFEEGNIEYRIDEDQFDVSTEPSESAPTKLLELTEDDLSDDDAAPILTPSCDGNTLLIDWANAEEYSGDSEIFSATGLKWIASNKMGDLIEFIYSRVIYIANQEGHKLELKFIKFPQEWRLRNGTLRGLASIAPLGITRLMKLRGFSTSIQQLNDREWEVHIAW